MHQENVDFIWLLYVVVHNSSLLIVVVDCWVLMHPKNRPCVYAEISAVSANREVLSATFDEVRLVDVLDSGDSAHLALMNRPELGVTFTKLHCWTLTHYSKCVFMDADTLVSCLTRECAVARPDPQVVSIFLKTPPTPVMRWQKP